MEPKAHLQQEIALFNRHEPTWIENGLDGQWVVVHGDKIIGIYQKFEDGMTAGQAALGKAPFLLRQISRDRRPDVIQRAFNRGIHRPY